MMQKLIERNSTIPTNKSQDFTTAEDYQNEVDIKVYEGERAMVKDNNYLGKFTMKGLPKTLRGVPKIKVTFSIDSDGILTVSAEDRKNDIKQEIQIENEKGRLSQKDIEKMLEEADKYKVQDSLTRDEMVAREKLLTYFSRVKKSLGDFDQEKLNGKERERIEKKFAEVDEWLKKDGYSKQDIETKHKELEAAWNTIMVRLTQAMDDFWDKQIMKAQDPDKVPIEKGGFCLKNGYDIRELIDDMD
mmetsp:Transcript_94332/g.172936  ORF Transcript_94332/g.172936 Transcript_94332/m.172936 type:complete len:245 (-) Transcript_94332:131-865(-)